MDTATVQVIVDAAVAAAAAQHQADLAAANAANALALQNAIAGLPPVGGAPGGGGALPPPAFALTPGLVNPGQPWNYEDCTGLKIFNSASMKLQETPFAGGSRPLKVLLIALSKQGESFSFNFMVSNQAVRTPADKNLLMQYGVITIENVRARAATYIGQQTRQAQSAVMVQNCIMASMGEEFTVKLVAKEDKYTVAGTTDGFCMLKVLICSQSSKHGPRWQSSTSSCRHCRLCSNPSSKSNITLFNLEVDDMIMSLTALDEGCQDLLMKLFTAYQTASDKDFRDFVRLKESEWENHEIADLELIAFMKQAEGHYKVMTEKVTWAKPTKDEADIMALAAWIDGGGSSEKASESHVSKECKGGKPGGGGQRPNEGEWAWKNKAPGANEPKEKTFKGKTYVACKFHKNTQ
jgi:hypothetical protein